MRKATILLPPLRRAPGAQFRENAGSDMRLALLAVRRTACAFSLTGLGYAGGVPDIEKFAASSVVDVEERVMLYMPVGEELVETIAM